MNYKSMSDLNADINLWLQELPRELDLIVGIPRSGLIVALILSEKLHLPVTDVDGLCTGRLIRSGNRVDLKTLRSSGGQGLRVLVVDDTIGSGSQLRIVKDQISKFDLGCRIEYGAVYCSRQSVGMISHHYRLLPTPRIFEWNILGHYLLDRCQFDMDGVLCCDPEVSANDDGPRYMNFLRSAKPLYLPTRRIDAIVTARLEKYRQVTSEWLERHKVQYNRLVMLDLPTMEARQKLKCHAQFKAETYKASKAELFVESSHSQALTIASLARKPVLCSETWTMLKGDVLCPGLGAFDVARSSEIGLLKTGIRVLSSACRTVLDRIRHFK